MESQPVSKTVKAGSSTYFFDLKNTKDGKPYLVVTQSRFKGEGSERLRASLIVFPENVREFLQALQEMVQSIGYDAIDQKSLDKNNHKGVQHYPHHP